MSKKGLEKAQKALAKIGGEEVERHLGRRPEQLANTGRILDPGQLQGARANRNPERASEGGYALEPAQERLIRRCNARDLALYERALRG